MKDNQQKWSSVSLSSNGQHIIVSEYNGNIYRSNNFGEDWGKENLNENKWNSINISKNALFFLAAGGTNTLPSFSFKKFCEKIVNINQLENIKSWVDGNDVASISFGDPINNITEINNLKSWVDGNDVASISFGDPINNITEINNFKSWVDGNDIASISLGS